MCHPGDGGQWGRAHSRKLINPVFFSFSHSGRLSTSLSSHRKASFRYSPALVPLFSWSYRTLKRKHNLLAKPVAFMVRLSWEIVSSVEKLRVGDLRSTVGVRAMACLAGACYWWRQLDGDSLSSLCHLQAHVVQTNGRCEPTFPQDPLVIHFLVIPLNHFSARYSSRFTGTFVSLCRRAGASSSYLLPAWDWASTHLPPDTGISRAKPWLPLFEE